MTKLSSSFTLLALLTLTACKPLAPPSQIAQPEQVSSSILQAAVEEPGPAPTPTATPNATPPAVWFTLDRVSVTTPDGVVGYPPGTMVRYVAEGLYFLDGHEIELSPLQVTPDLEVVNQVLAGREAQRQMIERQKIEAQRLRQLQDLNEGSSNQSPESTTRPLPSTPGTNYPSRAGWYARAQGPGSQASMPVLPAEPVAVQETDLPHAADSAEVDGPLSLPLRKETSSGSELKQPLQVNKRRPAAAAESAAQAPPNPGESLKSAVRQYQTGNTRYTVRVTGEQVEE